MDKICVLMGSPRKNGNTAAILRPFLNELELSRIKTKVTWLYDKSIQPCTACRSCQENWNSPNCIINDDMNEIFKDVLECDLLVLATPVYSWYCTPPMKTALDRLVYAMNKYYGDEKGPSLWKGKNLILVTTCGYPIEKGADLLEEGIKRYCKHSSLNYQGMFAERHLGYDVPFMDEEKEKHARQFARNIKL